MATADEARQAITDAIERLAADISPKGHNAAHNGTLADAVKALAEARAAFPPDGTRSAYEGDAVTGV